MYNQDDRWIGRSAGRQINRVGLNVDKSLCIYFIQDERLVGMSWVKYKYRLNID